MKNLLLSILTVAILIVFGTCFILAVQAVLGLFKAQTVNVQSMLQAGKCVLQGTTLICKG